MRIGRGLVRWTRQGALALLLPAILASIADALVLAGLRIFLAIVEASSLPFGIPHFSLSAWVGAMVLLVLVRLLALAWKQGVMERRTRYLEAFLQIWLANVSRRLRPAYFHQPIGLQSLQVAQEGCRTLVTAADAGAQALQAILQIAVFLPFLFYLSWPLTLAMLLGMLPLLSWLQKYLRRLGRRMGSRIQDQGRLESQQRDMLELYRHWIIPRERLFVARSLSQLVRILRLESTKLGHRKSFLVQLSDSVAALAVIAVLAFCGWWMQHGGMTGTDLILYAAALILCYKPVKDCLRVVSSIREALLVKTHLENLEQASREPLWVVHGNAESFCIQIRALYFSFHSIPPVKVFENLSLDIPTTKPVWLRGANGCGKTTLLRQLVGLESGESGEILWPHGIASSLGFLSHKVIVPSIEAYTLPNPCSATQSGLLQALGLADFTVREGLSAGQRQKLAIAWLFCSGRKALLLDEPFSFIAQKDRVPILSAMIACASEHGIWFAMASHDPFPRELEELFAIIDLGAI